MREGLLSEEDSDGSPGEPPRATAVSALGTRSASSTGMEDGVHVEEDGTLVEDGTHTAVERFKKNQNTLQVRQASGELLLKENPPHPSAHALGPQQEGPVVLVPFQPAPSVMMAGAG